MRILAVLVIFFLGSASAKASVPYPGQKAWLFIAQDLKELESGRSYYLKKTGESNLQQLVRIFSDRMAPFGFELKIEVNAKAKDLRKALDDPQSSAIFWVGHGSETSSSNSGAVAMQGIVLDSEGVNVAPLFQSIHPNLRWVSIVSCFSKAIVDSMKSSGYYRNNPVLHIEGRAGTAISQWGLAETATNAWYYLLMLKNSYPNLIPKRADQGMKVLVQRNSQPSAATIAITYNNTVLGFLSSEDSEIEMIIPENLNIQRLTVLRLNVLGHLPELEELNIESLDQKSRWILKRNSNGAPFGISRQLYER